MDAQKEILDAIEIIVDKKLQNTARISHGIVKSVTGDYCSVLLNGDTYDSIRYYGTPPTANLAYPVFIPSNNMALAFIISP